MSGASLCEVCGACPPLCEACIARSIGWLSGGASARGKLFAEWVVRELAQDGPPASWPPALPGYEESARVRRIARERVADGDGPQDLRLVDALAREHHRAATERYAQLRTDESERQRRFSQAPPPERLRPRRHHR